MCYIKIWKQVTVWLQIHLKRELNVCEISVRIVCMCIWMMQFGWCCIVCVQYSMVCVCVWEVLCGYSSSVKGPQQWQQAHLLHDYRLGCCDWEERPPTYTLAHFQWHINTHTDTTQTVSCLSQFCRPVTSHMASASSESVFVCVDGVIITQSQIEPEATWKK